MDDLISRQAALYAIYEICNEPVAWLFRAAREIEKLPSVQPEIIRCRDCIKCQYDTLFDQYWCNGREVRGDFYCADAERRIDERTD